MLAPVPGWDYSNVIKVHDLYTPQSVTADGGIYPNPVFVQWQKGGSKVMVYSSLPAFETAGTSAYNNLQWPINHSDNGYTSSTKSSPGFEFFSVFVSIGSIISYKKHKKV